MSEIRNPFTYGGALSKDDSLFRGRDTELDALEKVCLDHKLSNYQLVYGRPMSGKTSLLLRFEDRLSKHINAGVRSCRVDFGSLGQASSAAVYHRLAYTAAYKLGIAPTSEKVSYVSDGPSLSMFLEEALASPMITRLIFLVEGLANLSTAAAEELTSFLKAFHTARVEMPTLAKTQFVFVGGVELYGILRLQSMLLSVCEEVIYIGDLNQQAAILLIADGLAMVGVYRAQALSLGHAVYRCVAGQPRLTQYLGRRLAGLHIQHASPDEAHVEELAWKNLFQDALLEHMRQLTKDDDLRAEARRVLCAYQPVQEDNEIQKRLELLGVTGKGTEKEPKRCIPSSILVSVALAKWLDYFPAPEIFPDEAGEITELPAVAIAMQQKAFDQRQDYLQSKMSELNEAMNQAPSIDMRRELDVQYKPISDEFVVVKKHRAQQVAPSASATPVLPPMLLHVPAGEFIMGSSDVDTQADSDEKPQHTLTLSDYWISKTSVTNAQFRLFVESGGYHNPAYWTQAGIQWSVQKYRDHRWWNGDDQPMIKVTWFEAVAYCRWLSDQIGSEFRLPNEAEWEKAARGPHGLIYPWGNNWEEGRCNSGEAKLGRTTLVGTYPNGASYYGALHMAGNAWEWCTTKWRKPYPYQLEDEWSPEYLEGIEERIRRGGAHDVEQKFVRSAYRGYHAARFCWSTGFRVVCYTRT